MTPKTETATTAPPTPPAAGPTTASADADATVSHLQQTRVEPAPLLAQGKPRERMAYLDSPERLALKKKDCIYLGREVLTIEACAYLFDRSPTTVRAAHRKMFEESTAATLNFGGDAGREIRLLRLNWAGTQWPRPKDFADRLAHVREHGQMMSFDGVRYCLVLSPKPVHTPIGLQEPAVFDYHELEERRAEALKRMDESHATYPDAREIYDEINEEEWEFEQEDERRLDERAAWLKSHPDQSGIHEAWKQAQSSETLRELGHAEASDNPPSQATID